jgi:hypothetical protein
MGQSARWKGTLVTTTRGRDCRLRYTLPATCSCKMPCHQCRSHELRDDDGQCEVRPLLVQDPQVVDQWRDHGAVRRDDDLERQVISPCPVRQAGQAGQDQDGQHRLGPVGDRGQRVRRQHGQRHQLAHPLHRDRAGVQRRADDQPHQRPAGPAQRRGRRLGHARGLDRRQLPVLSRYGHHPGEQARADLAGPGVLPQRRVDRQRLPPRSRVSGRSLCPCVTTGDPGSGLLRPGHGRRRRAPPRPLSSPAPTAGSRAGSRWRRPGAVSPGRRSR